MAVSRYSVSANVTDASGQPIVGATVEIIPVPSFTAARFDNGAVAETSSIVNTPAIEKTDSKGHFSILLYANRIDRPRDYYRLTITAGQNVTGSDRVIFRKNFRMPEMNASLYAATPDTANAAVLSPWPADFDSQLATQVGQVIAHWAQQGDTSLIPTVKLGSGTRNGETVLFGDGTWKSAPGLTDSQVEELRKSVTADSNHIYLDERSLRFVSSDEVASVEIEMPGLTIEDQGSVEGNTSSVETINFAGNGVTVTRSGNKATVHITGTSSGATGLNQAQVDARVEALVSDWAEEGNTTAIPAAKLTNAPQGTSGLNQAAVDARIKARIDIDGYARNDFRDEVFNSFDSEGWTRPQTRTTQNYPYVSSPPATTASPSSPANFNYVDTVSGAAGYTDLYFLIRVPASLDGLVAKQMRLHIEDGTPILGSTWTRLEVVDPDVYYIVQATRPAGKEMYVEIFEKFMLDPSRINLDGLQELPTSGRTQGKALFLNGLLDPVWRQITDTDIQNMPTTQDKGAATAGMLLALKPDKIGYQLVRTGLLATTTSVGVVELATEAEIESGATNKVTTAKDVRAYVEGRTHNIDVLASFSGLTATQDVNRDLVQIAINTSRTFVVDGVTFTLGRVYYDTQDNNFAVNISPDTQHAKLGAFDIEINGVKLELAKAVFDTQGVQVDPNDLSPNAPYWHEWEWSLGSNPLTISANNEIKIFSPIGVSNYLPSGGTVGQYVTPTVGGGREWKNLPASGGGSATVTEEQVYSHDANILQAGAGIHLLFNPSTRRIRIVNSGGSGTVENGTTFPTAPTKGDLFELLQNQTIPRPAVVTPVQTAQAWGYGTSTAFRTPFGSIDRDSDEIGGVIWYANENVNAANTRGKVVVIRNSSSARIPTAVVIGGTNIPVTQLSSAASHLYASAVRANPFTAGVPISVQVLYGTQKAFPDKEYTAPHVYAYSGIVWLKSSEMSGADILEAIKQEPKPYFDVDAISGLSTSKFQRTLHHGPGSGLSITNTNSNRENTLGSNLLGTPVLDLNTSGQGEIDVEITLNISARSNNTIGFTSDNLVSYRFSDIIFASSVRALSAYNAGSAPNALVNISNPVDLYQGATKLGSVRVGLARNANGELGYLIKYTGGGSASGNLSITSNVEAIFAPTDSPNRTVLIDVQLQSARTVDTGATAGSWSPWVEILAFPAIEDHQVGKKLLIADLSGTISAAPSGATLGGSDRIVADYRITRTRNSVATTLKETKTYLRNNATLPGVLGTVTGQLSQETIARDSSAVGDVYKLEVRIASQQPRRRLTLDTSTALHCFTFS